MNPKRKIPVALLVSFLAALFCSMATRVLAHSPFESSVRMIAHEATIEISLTVGMDGGNALLAGAPAGAFQNRLVGPGFELPKDFAGKFFSVTAGGVALAPDKITVRTDGLEYDLVVEYPRPADANLGVDALYVEKLPHSFKSAFAMTDEMGNIFASRMLKVDDHVFLVRLPAALPEGPAAGVSNLVEKNPPNVAPEIQPAKVHSDATNFPATIISESNSTAHSPSQTLSFWDFLKLGFEHILTGYDHLLFLCGLLVMCRRVAPMLAIITCFTVAHSLTLALAALELVQISPRLVEPSIAATIVFIGVENFRGRVNLKTRCAVTLVFGLIHGFGFAGALRETGLAPAAGVGLAGPLLAFNLGVECGQLAVTAVFLPVLFALRRTKWFEPWGTRLISAAVVGLGGFWLVQRGFFW